MEWECSLVRMTTVFLATWSKFKIAYKRIDSE